MLVVEEAGGRVTDVEGAKLDFRRGRTLVANQGVVATCGPIHDEVVSAVKQVRGA
jgi:3'(2'), 5'-bisphosphate nucleotidase